jgi:hypothetical protein
MSQSHHRSDRPAVKDNGVLNARRALGKPKSNATSFKKGRKKTGGRKAGTPNRTTGFFREAMLAGAEAAGNELGGDGLVSYFKWLALGEPKSFLPALDHRMPQQLEPEQTSPPEEETVLHTGGEVCEHLRRCGVRPDQYVLALVRQMAPDERENVRKSWSNFINSMSDDRCVEDDASDAPTRGDEVKG